MMATKNCPDCGSNVSSKAERCPSCGRVLKNKAGCSRILFYSSLGIIFLVLWVSISKPSGSSVRGSSYKILMEESSGLVDSYNVLINSGDYSKKKINEIINAINKQECSRKCNIYLWDNEDAYNKDTGRTMENRIKAELLVRGKISKHEYEKYVRNQGTSTEDCFISQHLCAWKSFEDSTVIYYPFKSDLKGNIKKTCKFKSIK